MSSASLWSASISLFCALATTAQPVVAQNDTVRVPYAPTCSTCSIVFEPVGEFGSDRDSVLIEKGSEIGRDRFGRMYAFAFKRLAVIVFDSTGRILRTVGQLGDGPGEFGRRIDAMEVVADSLVIFGNNGRVVVYTPSLAVARSFDLAQMPTSAAVVLRDGSIVINGRIPSAGSAGMPLHLLSPTGRLLRSFGAVNPVGKPGSFAGGGLFVASPSQDAIWTWSDWQFHGEEWNVATGKRAHILQVTGLPWTPVPPQPPNIGPALDRVVNGRANATAESVRPDPVPSSRPIRIDGQNRMWLVTQIPLKNGDRSSGTLRDCASVSIAVRTVSLCRRIDVIDLTTGRLLLSQLVNRPFVAIQGTDLVYESNESTDGVIHIRLFRLRFLEK